MQVQFSSTPKMPVTSSPGVNRQAAVPRFSGDQYTPRFGSGKNNRSPIALAGAAVAFLFVFALGMGRMGDLPDPGQTESDVSCDTLREKATPADVSGLPDGQELLFDRHGHPKICPTADDK